MTKLDGYASSRERGGQQQVPVVFLVPVQRKDLEKRIQRMQVPI